MDGVKSIEIARVLQNATNHTKSFYGNDIRTSYQMLVRVLQYESQQQGFDLAATRDVEFNEVCLPAVYSAIPYCRAVSYSLRYNALHYVLFYCLIGDNTHIVQHGV